MSLQVRHSCQKYLSSSPNGLLQRSLPDLSLYHQPRKSQGKKPEKGPFSLSTFRPAQNHPLPMRPWSSLSTEMRGRATGRQAWTHRFVNHTIRLPLRLRPLHKFRLRLQRLSGRISDNSSELWILRLSIKLPKQLLQLHNRPHTLNLSSPKNSNRAHRTVSA